MFGRLLKLLHVHWFRSAWETYGYRYEQCRCGRRRARLRRPELVKHPVAQWWLDGQDEPRRR